MCYSKANPPPFPVFFGQGRGILLHFQRIGIQGWLGTLRLNWSGGSVYAAALAVAAMRTDKIPKQSSICFLQRVSPFQKAPTPVFSA